jgi:hypothetical protein
MALTGSVPLSLHRDSHNGCFFPVEECVYRYMAEQEMYMLAGCERGRAGGPPPHSSIVNVMSLMHIDEARSSTRVCPEGRGYFNDMLFFGLSAVFLIFNPTSLFGEKISGSFLDLQILFFFLIFRTLYRPYSYHMGGIVSNNSKKLLCGKSFEKNDCKRGFLQENTICSGVHIF